ncbi:MAG: restriction endonuclease subunit S [Bacteroidales bacterium]|nr:restriction endonuclease subunit S [Bacteroidales bacterium]
MKIKLSSITEIVSGATPSTSVQEYYDGDVVWFTPKDLSDQGTKYISKGERNITEDGFRNCSARMIPPYNLLMSSRAPIGLLSINEVECCTNQGFKSLIVDRSKANVDYLYYYIKHHLPEVEALGSGTTFKEVSRASLEKWDIELPDLPTQEAIASVLSSLDRKISLNRKANEVLESMAKQLYDYWFVQFDFPNAEGKPYKSSGGKMVYNETLKREIPEGWEVNTLSEIGTFRNGINYDPNEPGDAEYRIVNVRNVSSTSLLIDSSELDVLMLDEQKANTYLIKEGDILITRSGNPGATRCYCECEIPAVYCGFIICFTPVLAIHRKYLLMFLKSREMITNNLKGGSIMPNISQDALKPVCLPIPDTDVLKRFDDSIVPILSKLQANLIETNRLTSLRDYLLPLLMNGQVKVS